MTDQGAAKLRTVRETSAGGLVISGVSTTRSMTCAPSSSAASTGVAG